MLIRLNRFTPLFIIGGGVLLALALFVVPVAASSPFDIEFPIPELGGCAEKNACKTYCEDSANHDACFAFAAKHGLGASKEEVDETLKELEKDGGPGGCAQNAANPAIACKQYCDDASRIEECVAYAKDHNLMDRQELAEAEKVVAALKRGAKLPPQCTDARSCKETCEDPKDLATARACFEFGKEAGLLPEGVSVEQAEQAFTALESGTGPFKSFAEMRQCDNPPNDDILAKCIQFATDAGFIKAEDAEIIKKTGGKGPGGCRGREQCETYCENPDNQESCFAFGQEHGLIREEDKARMQEGIAEMRRALEDAPPEVTQCIREAIPELDAILAGEKLPSPALGGKMQVCFENFFRSQALEGMKGGEGDMEGFGGPPGEGGFPGGSGGVPPEVAACLSERFGIDLANIGKDKEAAPADLQTKIGECVSSSFGGRGEGGQKGGDGGPPEGDFGGGFKDRPCPAMPTVDSCGPDEALVGQEVPGCGFYGRCVPKGNGAPGQMPPSFLPVQGTQTGEGHPPPEGFYPPERVDYQTQYEQEVKRQTREQIEQQTQAQYQQQLEQSEPPSSPTTYPSESYTPPPSYTPPSGGEYPPPPSGTEYHPSFFRVGPNEQLIGSVWEALKQLRNAER